MKIGEKITRIWREFHEIPQKIVQKPFHSAPFCDVSFTHNRAVVARAWRRRAPSPQGMKAKRGFPSITWSDNSPPRTGLVSRETKQEH